MLPITAVIISHNEEDRIGACIASVREVVDEVLVIDSHSTDNTRQVALDLGARVESIDWKGYGGSKNYGNQIAKNDWILSLDCDEASSIQNGRSPGWLKVFFGAGFKAFHSFIIKGGFRDGRIGWKIAKMNAYLVRSQIRSFRKLSRKK